MIATPEQERAWRAAHRAALDHVLAVAAEAHCAEELILRGGMLMLAYGGRAARPPADLDWVVLPSATGRDPLDPYPYVHTLRQVQQPEADVMWEAEEPDLGGLHPRLPPEGLTWVDQEEIDADTHAPHEGLTRALERRPEAAGGVVLDVAAAWYDGGWAYRYVGDGELPGVRLVVPWRAPGLPPGETRMDFACDEWLPQAPVHARIPRADGGRPTLVRAASRELSLAWKVLWLLTDAGAGETAQPKDLYDAVLLAEAPETRLSPALLASVLRRGRQERASLDGLRVDEGAWAAFRAAHPQVRGRAFGWIERLVRRLAPVLADR